MIHQVDPDAEEGVEPTGEIDPRLRQAARLFGQLLVREPDAGLLEELTAPEVAAALGEVGVELPASTAENVDALAAEFFEAFVNPRDGGPLVQSLAESGHYEADAAQAVRKIAAQLGVDLDADAARGAAPDQLGAELLLWVEIAERAPESARDFAVGHLAWAAPFLRRHVALSSGRAPTTGAYAPICAATADLIDVLAAGE